MPLLGAASPPTAHSFWLYAGAAHHHVWWWGRPSRLAGPSARQSLLCRKRNTRTIARLGDHALWMVVPTAQPTRSSAQFSAIYLLGATIHGDRKAMEAPYGFAASVGGQRHRLSPRPTHAWRHPRAAVVSAAAGAQPDAALPQRLGSTSAGVGDHYTHFAVDMHKPRSAHFQTSQNSPKPKIAQLNLAQSAHEPRWLINLSL